MEQLMMKAFLGIPRADFPKSRVVLARIKTFTADAAAPAAQTMTPVVKKARMDFGESDFNKGANEFVVMVQTK
jgi:hypothetical protein